MRPLEASTLQSINNVLWTLGVLLNLGLLLILLRRRVFLSVPLFTGLLVFYFVRSIVLLGVGGHLSRLWFARLYSAMGLTDTLLQVSFAVIISGAVLRSRAPSHVRPPSFTARVCLVFLLFALSSGLTLLAVVSLPRHSPAPAERGTLFCAFTFLLVLLWSQAGKLTKQERAILGGFAALSVAAILSQCGKCVSASLHNANAFSFWAYLHAGTWLLVLAVWIFWYVGVDPARPRASSGLSADR